MTYEEFQARSHFSEEEVLALAYGRLVGDAPPEYKARLPLPPMLMVDRITSATRKRARTMSMGPVFVIPGSVDMGKARAYFQGLDLLEQDGRVLALRCSHGGGYAQHEQQK